MKRVLLTGFAVCALALGSALSASAMPAAPSSAPAVSDGSLVQVKGGRGHGGGHMRGHRGRHLGWTRGRHRGWR
jgi:hypothetical protein